MTQIGDHEDRTRAWLAIGLGASIAFVMGALFIREVPASNRDLLIAMSNQMLGVFATLVAYYAKTGIGNDRKKDDTLNVMARAAAAKAPDAKPDVIVPAGEAVVVRADDPDASA